MTEYINVTVQTTQPRKISVKPSTVAPNLQITVDPTQQNAKLSRDWAIGEGLIQNEDYSSKTWAAESKSSADLSKMYSEAASLDYNNLSETIIQYNEQISGVVAEGINTIETTKTVASEYVETTANESIAEVNQAKEQAIKDFNKASDKVNYLFVMPIGTIGFSPFPIDETKGLRRILNGQIIIQEQFTGFVKWLKENIELYPQMACTEEEWQVTVTMSTYGQCGKFVIDDEAGTIRLPKITGFIQGLTDLASLGELVEAGLPSISHTHTRGTMNITGEVGMGESSYATGAFTKVENQSGGTQTGGSSDPVASFDASKTWSGATSTNSAVPAVYGKSSTVQPEAIRYPYFIQVATGAEETVDVTREIELNNPFFFGYYQYFEVAPNNISWLKSEGQWNDKAVYTDYYNWILTNANKGVEKFKLSTDTYDDYCWVVNTADETFRLPIKVKQKFLNAINDNMPVVGNGITIGLGVQMASLGLGVNGATGTVGAHSALYGTRLPTSIQTIGSHNTKIEGVGLSTDPTKSGIVAKITQSEVSGLYLYFYVGETVQNANLVNIGRIEEVVVNKINRTGDTMTGALDFRTSSDVDYTSPTFTGTSTGSIVFKDKNNKRCGQILNYGNTSNNLVTRIDATRNINGSDVTASIYVYVDASGNKKCEIPICRTKATTSSSASVGQMAVVIQNYVSGTSWYRVWSDGWIEQGGYSASSKEGTQVTLLKTFSNSDYNLQVTNSTTNYADSGVGGSKVSASAIKLYHNQARTLAWYACGY